MTESLRAVNLCLISKGVRTMPLCWRDCDSFPHEIGLFLGYPAVDVKGFMEHRECKCTGLWKVFESDEAEAQRYFARCRRCTEGYLKRNQQGWSLSRLTIQPRQFSYRNEQTERKETA